MLSAGSDSLSAPLTRLDPGNMCLTLFVTTHPCRSGILTFLYFSHAPYVLRTAAKAFTTSTAAIVVPFDLAFVRTVVVKASSNHRNLTFVVAGRDREVGKDERAEEIAGGMWGAIA